MATRPSVDLDWAENDVVDPTSGENNKVEPPTAWKNNGWGYQEKPPRNYDNYHKWNTGQWVKYLDEIAVRPATHFLAATNADAETKLHADTVCDGTDDHTDINAAISGLPSVGGKVLLSEGTFTIAGEISLDSNVHLQGMGVGATIIKVKDSDTGDYIIADITNLSGVTISDLTINGNSASASGDNVGISITNSAEVLINRVRITGVSIDTLDGEGIHVVSGSSIKIIACDIVSSQGAGIYVDAGGPIIDSCMISSSGGAGINSQSDSTSIVGCWVTGSNSYGIVLAGDKCRIVGCHIATNGSGGADGILVQGSYSIISDCYIGENEEHGIEVSSGDYNIIKGCMVFDNSQASAGTNDGIYIGSGGDYNNVHGNLVRGSVQHQYGINCASTTSYVHGNMLAGSGATGPLNGASKTSWGSNQVWTGSVHTAITSTMNNVTA